MQLLDQTVEEGGRSVAIREGTVPVNWLPAKFTLPMELPVKSSRSTVYPQVPHMATESLRVNASRRALRTHKQSAESASE